ncbi:MAG TPA: membrane protein insertion efficiency factor YidD, partial [Moraxellaceae bacterium]
MKILLILPIRFYQVAISPLMAPHCRFHPTCSAYAVEALQRFGAARGAYLALHRLMRCHPWAAGGLDPVPTEFSLRARAG